MIYMQIYYSTVFTFLVFISTSHKLEFLINVLFQTFQLTYLIVIIFYIYFFKLITKNCDNRPGCGFGISFLVDRR